MNIALQVHVDTYRGTVEGVPALLALFRQYGVQATFLFSLGPDHTGRALRRIFRPGFFAKVQRTSVTKHYGYKTLMYGVFLPGPHIARKAGHILRAVRDAGHEVGVHCYDHVRWQDFVYGKDEAWTCREMDRAMAAFNMALGQPPSTLGAAGWQLNPFVLRHEEKLGFRYASDTRGEKPFWPEMGGIRSRCLQIPTTLPTLDELIGCDGITEDNVAHAVFKASQSASPYGHVYTLHAELEGQKLLPVMQELLERWQRNGDELVSLKGYFDALPLDQLPVKSVDWGEIPGRSGNLAKEGSDLAMT